MRKRARHRATGGSQLFSFLDAMICTMGALLVLVHAFARHGEVEATKAASTPINGMSQEEIESERETVEWRVAQLKQARDKTEAQLADERMKLSHIEDHQRRMFEHLKQLQIAAKEMVRVGSSRSEEQQKATAQLDAIRQRIAETQAAVDEAHAKAQQAAVSYAVVPFEGIHSTRRRPVYVECRDDSIVLQPEGVKILPEDFAGILGPGNPLASALRGMREYYARQTPSGQAPTEPYPLLLVRPDGVETYYAARTALDSWGTDFGYELIGGDWNLSFPEAPDPQLATLTRQIVADARMRMQQLAIALPQIRKRQPTRKYHASSRGGFVAEGGGGGGGGGDSDGPGGLGGDSLGSRWARGQSGSSSGNGTDGGDGNGGGLAGVGAGPGSGGLNTSGNGSAPGGSYANGGNGPGGTGVGMNGNGPGGSFVGGQNAAGGAGGNSATGPGGSAANGTAANGQGGSANGSYLGGSGGDPHGANGNGGTGTAGKGKGSAANGTYAGTDGQSGTAGNGASGGSGQYGPGGNTKAAPGSGGTAGSAKGKAGSAGSDSAGQMADGSSGSSSSSGGGGGGSSQSSGNPNVSVGSATSSLTPSGRKSSSLAKTRGRNWGLPEANEVTVPAYRPILVELHNDQLIVMPEDRRERPKVTPLGAKTQDNIDEFVGNVWDHMKRWGPAGRNMYWKPTLVVDVKPGAADRYAELKDLLADSGLEVKERQPQPSTAKQPSKKTIKK